MTELPGHINPEREAYRAFLAMLADPDYREAVKHRSAAVLDSQLIRFGRRMPGPGFGELAATDNIID
ncbi:MULTISPECIES: hypothetical protein [unclassified Sphingomonas]|uniref:hypothetical protein n=1 Tax=unclassified Sphingomonas TaxID=196159 RepID=UPI000BDB966B|nr:MAG: hypothetical protein B7Z43_06720 [Sphingomonas sp. 12-62-6]OYX37909.1 MAG: hypothetical protein B7Y98_10900 [Sphingomonas sp. 32-62-10]